MATHSSLFTFCPDGSNASGGQQSECGASIEGPSMVPPSPDVLPEGGLGSEAKGLILEPSRVHGCVEDPNDTPGGVIPVDAIDDDTLSIDAIDTGYGKASKPRALSGSSRGRSPGPLHVDHSSDERRALFIAAHQLKASTTGQKKQ